MGLKKILYVMVTALFIAIATGVVYTISRFDLLSYRDPVEEVDEPSGPYIEFSEKAGFYNDSVTVNINAKGDVGNIYFTTDCSKPTTRSKVYTGDGIEFKLVANKEKAYTIRAAGINEEGEYTTKEIVSTYIINENLEARYTTAVISLVTEKSNLNDRVTGIFANENIFKTGIDFERDIHMEFFEADGELVFSQHGGIRIFGGYSRSHAQKSLRLYARQTYDDYGVFYFNPLTNQRGRQTGKLIFEYQKLLFRNSGNDWCVTQFRDALIHRIAQRTDLDYQDYRPMTVYLNGEYYGILNFREDTGTKFFENHYGVPEEGVTIISSHLQDGNIPGDKTQYVLDAGEKSELSKWKKDLQFAYTADMKNKDNYKEVCSLIDVENFAQYIMLQIYIANTDWPHNNVRLWRYNTDYDYRYTGDNPGFDGRWRFVIKDTDFGINMYDGSNERHNTLSHVLNSGDVFALGRLLTNLLKNDSFKEMFIMTMCDFMNYVTEPGYLVQTISEMQIGISSEMSYHMTKWRGSGNITIMRNWDTEVNKMRRFVSNRQQYLIAHFEKYFKISSPVTLTVTGSDNGTIYISNVPVKPYEVKELKYYPGMMIPVRWEPNCGYKFLYYYTSESLGFVDDCIVFYEDASIEPVFGEIQDYRKTLVINEYMSAATKDGGYDWVEIYNNTGKDINLKDYFLTDNVRNIDKWQFPGYTLKNGEYIVIKLTGEDIYSGYTDIHTNFKISEGETLTLAFRDGSVIDSVKIGDCNTDPDGDVLTMGRYPDIYGDFVQNNAKSPWEENIYYPYERNVNDSLRHRVLINGALQDTTYYAYINEGVEYISIDSQVYSASDYAILKKLQFIYVYSLDCLIFTK